MLQQLLRRCLLVWPCAVMISQPLRREPRVLAPVAREPVVTSVSVSVTLVQEERSDLLIYIQLLLIHVEDFQMEY